MAPRDGSNVYHRPSGIDAVTNTTISSVAYNTNVQDVEADLNTPRPIVAGGTGATTAAGAMTNLGGELAKQVVTNYSSTTFIPGSFYSASTATGAPVSGHAFSGICYVTDANNMFIEARDQDDSVHPGLRYVRQMKAGIWSNWAQDGASSGPSTSAGPWLFNNTLTFPPNTGQVRFNNATQSSATHVYISHMTNTATDLTAVLPSLITPGGKLFVQDNGTAANYISFNITSVVFTSGDADVTVTFSDAGSAIPNGAAVGVTFQALAGATSFVRYDAVQTLTTTQQAQARSNINVAGSAVLYDTAQTLTAPQQAQARTNIGAAAADQTLGYKFNSGTTFPPPSGTTCFNNATQNSTTELFLSHLSASGVDITAQLPFAVPSGTNIRVQDTANSGSYKVFTTTAAPVNSGGDLRVTVSYLSGGTDLVSGNNITTAVTTDGLVHYDRAQTLTSAQQVQARQNVYAAPFDAMAYNGMQINGSMEVSQQYGSIDQIGWINAPGYTLDGWLVALKQATAGSTNFNTRQVAPPGAPAFGGALPNCLRITVTGAAANFASAPDLALFTQYIEGYRWARLGFGQTNSSQSVTIGFWIYASVTGTACLQLGSFGTQSRCYIQEFTVNAANTWEYKTLTFPPDTSGAANWLITNGIGANISFCFGGGATTKGGTANIWANWTTQYATANQTNFFATANNIVCLTGVVVLPGIEAPSAARSPLIMRPYDQELITCRRYYTTLNGTFAGAVYNATTAVLATPFGMPMRAAPVLAYSALTDFILLASGASPSALTADTITVNGARLLGTFSGLITGQGAILQCASGSLRYDARL